MIRKIFKKETERPHREKAQILAKYYMFFDVEEDLNFSNAKQRAIIDDINKKGMKLSITPSFDKKLFKKIKRNDSFFLLEFSLPRDNYLIQVTGRLCWANNDTEHFPAVTEIGVEFLDLSPEEKVMISRYVTLKKKERL